MSVNTKQGRTRGSRSGSKKQGAAIETDWLPWAYTPEQAAKEIGVSLRAVRQMMRIGWLRPLRPGHPAIGAHLVQRVKQGRPY